MLWFCSVPSLFPSLPASACQSPATSPPSCYSGQHFHGDNKLGSSKVGRLETERMKAWVLPIEGLKGRRKGEARGGVGRRSRLERGLA